jgi:DNA-directed RNA polymerase subunit alpha
VFLESLEAASPAESAPIAVEAKELGDDYGLFHIEPLRRGFAHTLGTPLRRTLLSSLPGAAIATARIDGALHEFSTLEFLREDIVEFLLNVKRVRLRSFNREPSLCMLEQTGPGIVTAGQIEVPSGVEIVNPDHYLAELTGEGSLRCEFSVEQGVGYVPSEGTRTLPIGVIPLDRVFTPVTKVEYHVEHAQVGQDTEHDRLVMQVWTDGSTGPHDALRAAAQQLVDSFSMIGDDDLVVGSTTDLLADQGVAPGEPLEDLKLSNRAVNCLKRHGVETIDEIAAMTEDDLFALRGMGVRLVDEIRAGLAQRGLTLADGVAPEESS